MAEIKAAIFKKLNAMLKTINGTTFNLDFCKGFSTEQLRKIYNGEPKETLDLLIAECFPKENEQGNNLPKFENPPKPPKKK